MGIFENLDSRVDRFGLETCWIGAPLLSQSEHNAGGLKNETQQLTALWGIAQHHSFLVVKFLTRESSGQSGFHLHRRNFFSCRLIGETLQRPVNEKNKPPKTLDRAKRGIQLGTVEHLSYFL